MGRGGARLNAGAKSKWNNCETKTIRVPKNLADKILDYAQKLDREETIENETNSKIINLSNMSIRSHAEKPFIYLEEFLKVGYEIKPLPLSMRVRNSMNRVVGIKSDLTIR